MLNKTIEESKDFLFTYKIIRYPTQVEVLSKGEKLIGMEADPWNLNFGVLPKGMNGKRFIDLANPGKNTLKVKIIVRGNISRLVSFDKDEIQLYPGEKLKVTALLNTSLAVPGNYSGEIDIISKKAIHPFFNFLS